MQIYITEILSNQDAYVVIHVMEVEMPEKYVNARNIEFVRLANNNIIRQYKRGIYYKTKKTIFGEVGIDIEKLILKQFVQSDKEDVKGYITGPRLWNNWIITTQVPNRNWIATNEVNINVELEDLNVKLLKPKGKIDKNNYSTDETDQLIDISKNYKKFVQNFTGALIEEKFNGTKELKKLENKLLDFKLKANKGKKYKYNYQIKPNNLNEWGFY